MIERAARVGRRAALSRRDSQSFQVNVLFVCITSAALGACAPAPPLEVEEVEEEPGSAVVAPQLETPRALDPAPLFPMSPTEAEAFRDRSGSEVVVARVDGRRLVFAADADTASIAAIDPDRRRELGRTPVGGAPSQMLVGRDGRLYVALRDRSSVAVLEATGSPDGSLRERATIATAAEPVALAMTKGGAALLVASGWGGKLEGFRVVRVGGRSRLFEVSLPREPRAIALSEDSETAFVSHMMGGVVSAVSLGAFGGDGAAPESAISPVRVASISVRGGDFRSVEVGCSNCHREEAMFADGSLHDVSSSAPADRSSVFDTPSLRFVGGTAPYFHDGRYATLRALLAGTRKTMGMTDHLNEADITAIESYLLSL